MNHALARATSASLIRREVAGLPLYDPGADPDEVATLSGSRRVVKLSNNESPFGISPAVAEAVRLSLADGVSRYPDPTG